MTVSECLEEARETMLYLREKTDDYRMAELQSKNPLKRDLDSMVLGLDEKRQELDQLAQEAAIKGKRAYALIGTLDNPRLKEAMWSYYAYGLTEGAAMKRGHFRSRDEMRKAIALGISEIEKMIMEYKKAREGR